MKTILEEIREKFIRMYDDEPLLVSAPGRINLIGEHTDYNNGYVLPAAIDKRIVVALSVNTKNKLRLHAHNLNEQIDLPNYQILSCGKQWGNYLLGILAQFKEKGYGLGGINCVFGGNIPIGAGLSASGAMETGFAFGLNELFGLGVGRLELAKMCQQAEHDYAGVKCGIMDQFVSMYGKKGHAVKLDCKTLDYEYIPLELNEHDIILCDTKIQHSNAFNEYNTCIDECGEAISVISSKFSEVESLRDVSTEHLETCYHNLSANVYKRCQYVVEENKRVLKACGALEQNDAQRFGELMYQSHDGLKNKYNVSCRELDLLVEIARESGVVRGARMMGAGFGGVTINLVVKEKVEAFKQLIADRFLQETNNELAIYHLKIDDGIYIIEN